MKVLLPIFSFFVFLISISCQQQPKYPLVSHPNSESWPTLFNTDLSNAIYPDSIWTFEDGIFTATEDEFLWTDKDYDNFVLDLEFKNADGTNSGVIVYCSDLDNWLANSVEIQIADNFNAKIAKTPRSWQCGAIFGRKPATKPAVKKPGEWNKYTITCIDNMIYVLLNDEQVNTFDMTKFTEAKSNPDGSRAPSWLSTPPAELPTYGKIGFQGKHAGAPVYFRNIRVKEINK